MNGLVALHCTDIVFLIFFEKQFLFSIGRAPGMTGNQSKNNFENRLGFFCPLFEICTDYGQLTDCETHNGWKRDSDHS